MFQFPILRTQLEQNDIEGYGLPWLAYRSDLKHALDMKKYLKREEHGGYNTHEFLQGDADLVFLVMQGKVAQFRKAVSERVASGFPESKYRALAKRLGIKL